jgi:hypothetical protein
MRKMRRLQRQSFPKQTTRIFRKYPPHSPRMCAKTRTSRSNLSASVCRAVASVAMKSPKRTGLASCSFCCEWRSG